jgi:hypothetical protein
LDNDVTADTSVRESSYDPTSRAQSAERRASRIPREQDPGQSISHSCVGMRAGRCRCRCLLPACQDGMTAQRPAALHGSCACRMASSHEPARQPACLGRRRPPPARPCTRHRTPPHTYLSPSRTAILWGTPPAQRGARSRAPRHPHLLRLREPLLVVVATLRLSTTSLCLLSGSSRTTVPCHRGWLLTRTRTSPCGSRRAQTYPTALCKQRC